MNASLAQHREEVERNLRAWHSKPLLREVYAGFYAQIATVLDPSAPGRIVELGSGIGNLKQHFPQALATDIFPQPWLDLVCDAYAMPFEEGSVSNLVLFDVFHHLERPLAFLHEAARVLSASGRVILFEPYISFTSYVVYGALHPEPVAWRAPINLSQEPPREPGYYAAQGNATRLCCGPALPPELSEWTLLDRRRFSAFHYLLSGGYSRCALYPAGLLGSLRSLDRYLSRWPRLFGARCLVVLGKRPPHRAPTGPETVANP